MTYYATLGGDVVKALHFDEDCDPSETPWLAKALADDVCVLIRDSAGLPHTLKVNTSGGVDTAERGDWVLRGVEGEIYACKDSIFKATYEQVPDDEVLCEATLEKMITEIRAGLDGRQVTWRG